jgi:predicted PurR-regulated permease PerM
MDRLPDSRSTSDQHQIPARTEYRDGTDNIATKTLIVISIVGLCWLVIELNRFLMLVFAAIVIAAVFDAIAGWLCRMTGMRRSIGLAISVVGMIGLFVGAFTLFGAQIGQEFDTIKDSLPNAMQGIESFLNRFGLGEQVKELAQLGSNDLSKLVSQAGGYALAASSGVADFILVIVGAIFLASNPATYRAGFLKLIPSKAEDIVSETFDETSKGLKGWMVGQAVSSLLVAALTWFGLMMLGVPAAGGLSIIAGLLDVIPMIGPVLAGVPAVLLAFTVSPMTALWTLLLFLGIQQLQGNFLQPMIQKHAVDIPPAVLLFAVLAAGLLFGFLGVLLAAPLTIIVFVFVQRLYVGAVLGKSVGETE